MLLKKIKKEIPNDLLYTSSLYPKEGKSICNGDTCTLMLKASVFTISKLWNNARFP
jgi:hypothetical protein